MNVTSRRSEFLPFLLVLFTGALLAALIAPKGLELFGYGGMTLEAILARPEVGVGRSLLLSQGLYALFMFLLPALFLYQRWHDGRVASLLQPSWSALDSLLAWIILPALLPALNACNSLWVGAAHGMDFMAPHFEAQAQSALAVDRMLFMPTWVDHAASILVFVVLAAFSEEFLFRASLQRFLHGQAKPFMAIIGATIAFTIGHMNFIQWPFLVGAGFTLGLVYYLSGRLWISFGAHLIHNGLTYYWTQEAGPNAYGTMEEVLPFWIILCGLIIALSAGWLLIKRHAPKPHRAA